MFTRLCYMSREGNGKAGMVDGILRTTTNLLQWSVLKRSARTTKSSEPLETKKGKGGAGGGNRTHGLGIMRPSLYH